MNFFRRLQWKLTFSYAAVTVITVVILAALLVSFVFYVDLSNNTRTFDSFYWSKTAFQDNIPDLLDDPQGLQQWLDRVQALGFRDADFQSYTVRESLDYASTFVEGTPIFVLDPALNLIASSPAADPQDVGQPFRVRAINGYTINNILQAAQVGDKNYAAQSLVLDDGRRLVAFPLRAAEDEPVSAIVIYQLKAINFVTPSNMELYSTFFIVTAVLILGAALPVGALFGWLASRGLRRRLTMLSSAARAWSQGDFSVMAHDKSGDEVGELTRTLNRMAEQLQTHMDTRDQLARVEVRNRLARDLHDTVKQQTYAARMQLSAARNLLTSDPSAAGEHLGEALKLNRETQQELKQIIDELRPAALDGRGLAQALTEYTARWREHSGIPVETVISGERALPLDVEQALYRVLQESLANIARHAGAETVLVSLAMSPEQVTLVVADDGQGFDPQAVSPNSLGLAGMQERLAEVGGRLDVQSGPSAGTRITAEVQLKP